MKRITCAAVAVLLASGSAGGADLSQRVVAILSGSPDTTPDATPDAATVERLGALPPDALPILFGLVETGHLPPAPDAEDGAPRRLTEGQEAAALAGMRALGRGAVREYVAARLAGNPGIATRVASLRVLGAMGGAGELELAVSAAMPSADRNAPFPRVVEAFVEAAEAILRRDSRALRSVDFVIRGTHRALRHHLVKAVGATRSARGIEPLADLLGEDPRLDVVLLTQIARLGPSARPPIDVAILRNVREYLWSDDEQLVREAAHVTGVLDDFEAMQRLVELVRDPRTPIRESAHWALRRMTGLALRADARLWRSWYAAESSWYRERAPGLVESLRHETAGEVVKALSELARHRLHRHRLAVEIEAVLRHERAHVRRLGCIALRQLGSPVAVPALVERLLDPDESVILAAGNALRSLTGLELPPSFDAWQDSAGPTGD